MKLEIRSTKITILMQIQLVRKNISLRGLIDYNLRTFINQTKRILRIYWDHFLSIRINHVLFQFILQYKHRFFL